MPNSDTFSDVFQFVVIFILFIFSWISVSVVGRALDNFTFSTLKLNEKSTYQTTIIALTVVAIEITIIYYLKSFDVHVYDSSSWAPPQEQNITTVQHASQDHINFSSIDEIRNVCKIVCV